MVLPDVNVLVYAHREDSKDHAAYRQWFEQTVNGDDPYGVSDLVLSGFLRVVTHPKVFKRPTPLANALTFVEQVRNQANSVHVRPGERHWEIFERLCRACEARGSLVPDAFFAALAIESGCEWITTDRDYSRFKGLRWRHPLQ
jgi:toxin-antitoxin system PIN domain toxin